MSLYEKITLWDKTGIFRPFWWWIRKIHCTNLPDFNISPKSFPGEISRTAFRTTRWAGKKNERIWI